MTPALLLFSVALIVAQFALPRRLAFLPLLIAACHTPYYAMLGGQFSAVRLMIVAGLFRATLTGALNWNPRQPLDVIMAFWSALALVSALGHHSGNPFIYRAGLVLNVLGTYLYSRAYIRDRDDFLALVRALVFVIVPLAVLLLMEAATARNGYAVFGTRYDLAITREGHNRAMGPFGTPILSGTMGAICFPLFVALWKERRKLAMVGIGASLLMIAASRSSGPIGTLMLGSGALFLWRWRTSLTAIKFGLIGLLVCVQLFRHRSVWYLLSLIDFVGGSTGWHRSRLLESSIEHIDEWWLYGTDYTRHWMPFGLPSNPDHCDLTSYYVHLGVIGGLPLLLMLILILWKSFRMLGSHMRALRSVSAEDFLFWCVGSALFGHAATFFTISYFDQLYVFFYGLVAAIPALIASPVAEPRVATDTAPTPPAPPRPALVSIWQV